MSMKGKGKGAHHWTLSNFSILRSTSLLGFLVFFILVLSTPVVAVALPDFVSVVDKVSSAVVNISTTQKPKKRKSTRPHGRMPSFPEGSPFDDLFKRFDDDLKFNRRAPKSLGSGFIISADGYVLTNHHVIRDADEIIVKLSDRRELLATVVGSDERSDVALLKLDAKDLPVVKMGDSNELRVGEWVLAIGSPFDFDHTVTSGIVSALSRSLPNDNYVPFIQTDVAINPGNSGGPLLNLKGEVVGINAQIYSRTGGFMGLSFTIPISLAMDVVEQIRTNGRVSRGWLGVFIQDVTRELAESFGMPRPEGALVSRVIKDSPAEGAGIKVGDVIIRFNDKLIINSSALPPIVGITNIGKSVPVVVVRDGSQVTLDTLLGELPEEDKIASLGNMEKAPKDLQPNRLKIKVKNLTVEQRADLQIAKGGVVILDVAPGPAFQSGLLSDDVIMQIDNENVKDTDHFEQMVKALPENKNIAVLIQRQSGAVFLALKIKK
ncbi:Outer membrane stress sensor protease DegS [hydrothermal vent metagenome]|uniref:Probable periplasmic serine endoprotease DegP-like n=1 Tax=hydrothermal vent metagenome TaxID=652676 RepID=A0A3B0Z3J0_9ZZZZ